MIVSSLGFALLVLVLLDIVVTTLTMRSAGPVTSRAMQLLWRVMLRVTPAGRHRVLLAGGIAIVVSTVLAWAVLSWAGWALVFLGTEDGVVNSTTMAPATAWQTVYFAGTTLFTLGPGDFNPSGTIWQILTVVCVANGLLAMTLSVTYIVPVLSAAAGRRQLAAQIHAIGATPQGILRWGWDGRSFSRLEDEVSTLAPSIILQAQQHLAYPALHYFHSDHQETALPLRIAALDEALTILLHAPPGDVAPDAAKLRNARTAISFLLNVMNSAHIPPADAPPPPPSIEGLEGLPKFKADSFGSGLDLCRDRRHLLLSWIRNDGRSWSEVGVVSDEDHGVSRFEDWT